MGLSINSGLDKIWSDFQQQFWGVDDCWQVQNPGWLAAQLKSS